MQKSVPPSQFIDDNSSIRRGLERLLRSMGWTAETFASAQDFLARVAVATPSCVVLNLQFPALSEPGAAEQMAVVGFKTPIIFLTDHGNISTTWKQ